MHALPNYLYNCFAFVSELCTSNCSFLFTSFNVKTCIINHGMYTCRTCSGVHGLLMARKSQLVPQTGNTLLVRYSCSMQHLSFIVAMLKRSCSDHMTHSTCICANVLPDFRLPPIGENCILADLPFNRSCCSIGLLSLFYYSKRELSV